MVSGKQLCGMLCMIGQSYYLFVFIDKYKFAYTTFVFCYILLGHDEYPGQLTTQDMCFCKAAFNLLSPFDFFLLLI